MATSSFQTHPRLLSYQRLSQRRLSVIQPVRENAVEAVYAAPAAHLQLPAVSATQAPALQTQSKAQLRSSLSSRDGFPGMAMRTAAPQ